LAVNVGKVVVFVVGVVVVGTTIVGLVMNDEGTTMGCTVYVGVVEQEAVVRLVGRIEDFIQHPMSQ
jgi:hypothetical protein